MLRIVAYKVSLVKDHLLGVIFEILLAKTLTQKAKKAAIIIYSPMLVIDKFILSKSGVSILNKFLISNWSRGLIIVKSLVLYSKLLKIRVSVLNKFILLNGSKIS
jgi:hypothetical protein